MTISKKTALTSRPLFYLDTSAYLSLLLGEKMSNQIEKTIADTALCSSSLLALEVERNLVRLSREKIISEQEYSKLHQRLKEDIDVFVLKNLNLDLSLNGIFPAVKTPRSSDLAHLRTALWFLNHEKLDGFMTLDRHQADAAKELKLPLIEF